MPFIRGLPGFCDPVQDQPPPQLEVIPQPPRRRGGLDVPLRMRNGPGVLQRCGRERLSRGSKTESGRSRRRLLPRTLFQNDCSHCEADQCGRPYYSPSGDVRIFGRMRPFTSTCSGVNERSRRRCVGPEAEVVCAVLLNLLWRAEESAVAGLEVRRLASAQ